MNECGMPRLATAIWLTIGAFTLGAVCMAIALVVTDGDIHV